MPVRRFSTQKLSASDKREWIVRQRFPQVKGDVLDTIWEHFGDEDHDYSSRSLCDAIFKAHDEDIIGHTGLSSERREKIEQGFEDKSVDNDALFWELTHHWLIEYGEYDKKIDDMDAQSLQDLYREIEKARKPVISQRIKDNEATAFFNNLSADADFSHWKKFAIWEPEEAVALSFGKDPRVVNKASLFRNLGRHMPRSDFFKAYRLRLLVLERAVEAGALSIPMTVEAFLSWAKANDWELPAELDANALSKATRRQSRTTREIEHKELRSAYKLILGLAEYLSKGKERNEVTAIVSALDQTDNRLSRDAVRNSLRKAKSFISES